MARVVPLSEHNDLLRVLSEAKHALSVSEIHNLLAIKVASSLTLLTLGFLGLKKPGGWI